MQCNMENAIKNMQCNLYFKNIMFIFLDAFLVDVTEEDLKGRVIEALLPLQLKYKIEDPEVEEEIEGDICIKLGQMVFEGIVQLIYLPMSRQLL